MEDDFGDGWVGGLPGRSNSWTITQGLMEDNLETQVADGILPDGHHSSTSRVCLENGAYTFESTSIAAWSSESAWTLCGVEGGLGGSMEFQVSTRLLLGGEPFECGSLIYLFPRACGMESVSFVCHVVFWTAHFAELYDPRPSHLEMFVVFCSAP